MRLHTLNLFKIDNLHELDFSYRLLSVDITCREGKEELFNRQIRKAAQTVTSITGAPAVIVSKDGQSFIAVPASVKIEEIKADVTPHIVTIKPTDKVHTLLGKDLGVAENITIAQKFLDFEIRSQLGNHHNLWSLNGNQFFYRKPTETNKEFNTDIFGGFSYKLERLNGQLYFCVNLATKYADTKYLTQYLNTRNIDSRSSMLIGRRALYQNGDNWYAIEIKGFGNEISKQEFDYEGKSYTVLDFINQKTRNARFKTAPLLKESDISLFYTYPGRSMEPHNAAASLARIIFSPKDPQAKALHSKSIKDPSRRFEGIQAVVNEYFVNLRFSNKALKVNSQPLEEQLRTFQIPPLKYNKDKKLQVGNTSRGANVQVRDFGMERKRYTEEYGILTQRNFDRQYLIVPDHMDKEMVEAFKRNAEYKLKKLAVLFPGFTVIRYPVKSNTSSYIQIREMEKALQQQNVTSGFALFLLPDISSDSKLIISTFHDCLKSKFYPALKVQCASAAKISSYFQKVMVPANPKISDYKVPLHLQNKFSSYLFNLVMEHLIVNRKWPYALDKNLHYDIYIGIDVHGRYAGFTFFFKNGEQLQFQPEAVPKKASGQRAEKLKAKFLFDHLYPKLKDAIPLYAPNANVIVICRDGRSFGEEVKALKMIIDELAKDGTISQNICKYGVIDIHKQSALPLRVAAKTDHYNPLQNPACGTYKLFGSTQGFIFNTGYPFNIRGTAKPLHLIKQWGNVEFLKTMEDLFCMSMLAYSAPDKGSSLPNILKLIDTLLEPLSAATEIPEEDEEEVSEIIID